MVSSVDRAAELLSRLVACPSVNPQRAAPSGPPLGEAAMAQLLAGLLGPWGAWVETRDVAPGRPNFLARFEGADPGRTLLLEAHADTVPVEGMTVAPFEPVVRQGRLYGRGSCDCKGPMAAMLLAIRTVLDERGRPPVTLWFVSTADEELAAAGARRLMADGFRADAAVVAEPTDLDLVYAHKGAYRCRIVTRGRAAHSSDPSMGTSAIRGMARVVEAVEGPLARELAGTVHPVLGPATVSVGVIRGGTQANVVPDRCEIEVDRRTLPGEGPEAVADQFRRTLDALGSGDTPVAYDLEPLEWYPPFEEDREAPLMRLAGAACQKVLGRADFKGVPWCANVGVFKQAGMPCVLFGPGSVRQAHTADESVDLADVVRAAGVYAEIIRRF
ncbi:MAG TPA: M20 family metallopeptidase [Phycisphaerae bacterium]|nr:M20 family metallopeptidase [Phycisphaerae bacterium]